MMQSHGVSGSFLLIVGIHALSSLETRNDRLGNNVASPTFSLTWGKPNLFVKNKFNNYNEHLILKDEILNTCKNSYRGRK